MAAFAKLGDTSAQWEELVNVWPSQPSLLQGEEVNSFPDFLLTTKKVEEGQEEVPAESSHVASPRSEDADEALDEAAIKEYTVVHVPRFQRTPTPSYGRRLSLQPRAA